MNSSITGHRHQKIRVSREPYAQFSRSVVLLSCCLVCCSKPIAAADPIEDTVAASESVEVTRHPSDSERIAHWPFDEVDGSALRDTSGNQHDALTPNESGQTERARGLFGDALRLTGNHQVSVPSELFPPTLEQLTLSAWILPTEHSGYREILRKESGDRRVLFSLQHDGSILSLGLNIGGYIECDAAIEPAQWLDGLWHHCAGTFDGQAMRVYLDGQLVATTPRPGVITTGSGPATFLGSLGGQSEFFQGAIDDLRIYRTALTSQQIARIFDDGNRARSQYARQLQEELDAVYHRADSLAETMALCRQTIHAPTSDLAPEVLEAIPSRLRADFPVLFEEISNWTGVNPAELLTSTDPDLPHRLADRMVELSLEYKPLTTEQWARQSAEQIQHWADVAQIEQEYNDLVSRPVTESNSREWFDLILRLGPKIQWRPVVSEAVAPYVKPSTPPTRDRSTAEAREILQQDWLHQADQNPTVERIAKEIDWTRQLADRLTRLSSGQSEFKAERAAMRDLEEQLATRQGQHRDLYFAVREVKRRIAMQNPLLDFDQVVMVDMPFPGGSEWQHETRHRLGYMAVPGGRLLVLKGLGPDGHLRQLAPQSPLHGSFWRPDVSYDGTRILFCFKPHNEKAFHLYEVKKDGTQLVQLTDGPYDDLDPIYLPDGQHIVFSTTRGHTYVRCMPPTNAFVLARSDRDGRNVYLISRNNEPDYLPSVTNDGRIVYTRWEYTDKPLWRAQSLWTTNPDGTQVNTLWGNQSVWPDLLKDARSIPGSGRLIFTGSAHHNWFSGSVGMIDPDQGLNFPDGLTKVTADLPWPESGNGPVDPIESDRYHSSGEYQAYYSPYPLGEQDFLVSANRNGKFVLYLMDVDGNRELIYEGTHNVFYAQPLRPRVRPPVIDDRVDWPTREQRQAPQDGVIFSANVYQGAPAGMQGKAKYLRILNIDPKTYTYWYKRPYISTGPVVSAVQSDGVKRILGTVPVEEDGSVHFYAPSGKALHFQLLDDQYRALQTMRSFTGVMPGEYRGCLGCHESHSTAPPPSFSATALARAPSRITPPPWGEDTVSYARYVQPVLDRYCGSCHQGEGEARGVLDLTYRPDHPEFAEPYMTLIGRPSWGATYAAPSSPPPGWGIADMIMVEAYETVDPTAYRTPSPMTKLSFGSRLISLCSSGEHYDVRVDPLSRRRLIAWVDSMCPFRGREEICAMPDPVFPGVDWLSVRPRIQTAPTVIRPGPVD